MTVTKSMGINDIFENKRKTLYSIRGKVIEAEALRFLLSLGVNADEKEKIMKNENLIPMIIGRARGILYKECINSCYPKCVETPKGGVYCFEREPYEDRCEYCTGDEPIDDKDISHLIKYCHTTEATLDSEHQGEGTKGE